MSIIHFLSKNELFNKIPGIYQAICEMVEQEPISSMLLKLFTKKFAKVLDMEALIKGVK